MGDFRGPSKRVAKRRVGLMILETKPLVMCAFVLGSLRLTIMDDNGVGLALFFVRLRHSSSCDLTWHCHMRLQDGNHLEILRHLGGRYKASEYCVRLEE